jgi:hypothetical protein
MRQRLVFSSVPLLALILAFAPAAHASTKLYVNGATGNDSNNCKSPQHACKTIGHAISLASSGDTVKVAPSTYTENLAIGVSLNILGADARTTVVDGNQSKTVFTISKGVVVFFSRLTIENGNSAGGYGGGIVNEGTLTISRCTITGNNGSGGYGGGIVNLGGTLTVSSSTITGNSASGGYVGGIFNYAGTATVTNSTITGNSGGYGGGIVNDGGPTTVSSSTITGNSAPGGYGGGVVNLGDTVTFQNTIVADNSEGNCYSTMSSEGYNLSSDSTCNFNGKGDKNGTEPKLRSLHNNGGPTDTMAEKAGSPAIDAGNPSGCTDGQGHLLKTDQRGRPRHDKEDTGGCDMGAYERQKD